MEKLRGLVRGFMRRDFEADVRILNGAVARVGLASAGFEAAPPSVLTGDPYSLRAGACIGVFGLNPMWHGRAPLEARQTRREISEERLGDYELRRSSYFADDSAEYNWRHFSRLGNRIRNSQLGIDAISAREVFRRHAFVLDLLPWWSVNVDDVDVSRLESSLEPLSAWKSIVGSFLETLAPRLILVNGNGWREFAAGLLEVQLSEFRYGSGRRAFCGETSAGNIPVLVHGQVGQIYGPQSDALYQEMIHAWQRCTGRHPRIMD